MQRKQIAGLFAGALGLYALTQSAVASPRHASPRQDGVPLTLKPAGANDLRLGYMPVPVKLDAAKPAGVKKEPKYTSTPKYGVITLGDGPRASHVVAVDEPEGGDWKVYVDRNANGDLTDDGDGAWSKKNDNNGRVMYGVNTIVARASYGTSAKEAGSGEYGLGLYRFAGTDVLYTYRQAARVGKLDIGGKAYDIAVVENDADGLFNKSLDDSGKPVGGAKASARPVWLVVTGQPRPQTIDIRSPFTLDGKNYEATLTPDGSQLRVTPTTRAVAKPRVAAERPALLSKGVAAPNFTAFTPDGKPVTLAELKGKTVILDFWATWCGPCMKSMPHLETVYQAAKDKNIAVLAVCVWDSKEAFDGWLPKNSSKYTFPMVFDPAGRDSAKSIAGSLYKVSGIPTTYIIDKDGNVAASIVGYSDGDKRVEEELKKLGVEL